MRTLGERDAAALASVTAGLAVLDDAEPFPPHFLGRLAALLASRDACYCELDRSRERGVFASWWEDGDGASEVPDDDAPDTDAYWRLRHQHPVCGYRERTNDWTSARAVSDFVTLREFHRTEIWNELYRDADVNHWIDVGLRSNGSHTRMFLFTRSRGAFGERDRLLLDLLQPHLQQRLDRVQAGADAADALASLEERDADDPRHVVLCTGDGVIEFASPESRRLLRSYLPLAGGRIPKHVLATLLHRGQPVAVERDERRLTIRAARSAGLLVVLLGEEDMRIDGSPRDSARSSSTSLTERPTRRSLRRSASPRRPSTSTWSRSTAVSASTRARRRSLSLRRRRTRRALLRTPRR